jgi:hypothetical protein
VTREWGWKDGWFSEAGLLAATEDERESTKAEKGGGGGLRDREHVDFGVSGTAGLCIAEIKSDFLNAIEFAVISGDGVAVEDKV